jgi:hypothetical protein
MSEGVTQRVELELTLDQVLSIVRQLNPREREIVWRAIEPRPWSQRLDALLNRIWSRVESAPISEQDIDAEVEQARTEFYAQSSR